VASIELRRTRNIVFNLVSMPPRAGKPAVICSSRADYEKQTGLKYDGEQDIAGQWKGALRNAAGAGWGGTREVWYVNIYGVPCGGTGGGLGGVGNGKDPGILLHELGHGFNLPHWYGRKEYPYVGNMLGIPAQSEMFPHVGPTWAFDLERKAFITPVENGKWKKDPMQGGGESDHKPYVYKFFSDYSLSPIRKVLEETQVVFDERSGNYSQWDPKTGAYTAPARQRGLPSVPIEDDVDVISILTSISGPTPAATIIYPPIGPHFSSLIAVPEVSTKAGLVSASALDFKDSNSNVCLRVTQGGKQRTYLLKVFIDNGAKPADVKSYTTYAINLPAKDGVVTKVELLSTPNIFSQGLKADAKVLKIWDGAKEEKTAQSFERLSWPKAYQPAKE
jgi:Peptidase M66